MNLLMDVMYVGLTNAVSALLSVPATGLADALSALLSMILQMFLGIPA